MIYFVKQDVLFIQIRKYYKGLDIFHCEMKQGGVGREVANKKECFLSTERMWSILPGHVASSVMLQWKNQTT